MEYITCVVDELNTPMYRVSFLKERGELEDVLNNHPEWRIETVAVD